ncbi:hypothetical protein A3766_05500 [Oleiphilus sp. HI0132]|nr:hypothetical protein A3766_05500 [Oleiphilus sp. HI0132]
MVALQDRGVAAVAHSIDLSIIVPVFNEAENIERLLRKLNTLTSKRCEVLLVDGGSTDGSGEIISSLISELDMDAHLIRSKCGRSAQQNAGAELAQGRLLLFLHADTVLPSKAINMLHGAISSEPVWGRFDIQLDNSAATFKVISWFINIRSRLTGIATGDQAIFVSACLFRKVGGFPDQPLMEDIELSKRLKRSAPPLCLKDQAITSARKWEKEGAVKTVLLMWRLRAAYFLGAKPEQLHRQYYKTRA